MKKFPPTEKSSFPYWFEHWKAFNLVAILYGVWRPGFLFHDIEKPFLMWWWKDYPRVQKYHREHARHHLQYKGKKPFDFVAMAIDWECSRFTKEVAVLNAWEAFLYEYHHHPQYCEILDRLLPVLQKLGLDNIRNNNIDLSKVSKS